MSFFKKKFFWILCAFVVLSFFYQNCSKVDFGYESQLAYYENNYDVEKVYINPQDPQYRPELKLTTIIDNSFSTSPIQKQMNEGFSSMIKKLRDYSGSMQLYTTTNTFEKDKNSMVPDKFAEYYESKDKLVKIEQSEIDNLVPEESPYTLVSKYDLVAPFTSNREVLKFDYRMSDEEFNNFTANYSKAINNIGTDGSDQEQGLCTLLRVLNSDLNPSAYHAYIIATNEDDQTTSNDCLFKTTKYVDKVADTENVQVKCEAGDSDCISKYTIDYFPVLAKKLSYKLRYIGKEQIESNSTEKNISIIHKAIITRTEEEFAFKKYQKIQKLSFEKYEVRDQIKIPQQSSYNYPIEEGKCIQNAVSCSDEHLKKISGYDVVPGTCQYTCVTEESNVIKSSKWAASDCTDDNGTIICPDRACNESDKLYLQGQTVEIVNNISFCEVNYVKDENERSITGDATNYTSCEQDSWNCNNDEKTYIRDKENLQDQGHIKSCTTICKEEPKSNPIISILDTDNSLVTNNKCPDVENYNNNSTNIIEVACSPEQRQLVESAGYTVGDKCDYICKEYSKYRGFTLEKPSSCTEEVITGDSCLEKIYNYQDQSKVPPENGDNLNDIFNCRYECKIADRPTPCSFDNEEEALCNNSVKVKSLEEAIVANCPVNSTELNLGTCAEVSRYRDTSIPFFKKVYGQQEVYSPISKNENGEDDVVFSVMDNLYKVHDEKFFLASFIYPTDDKECVPPVEDFKGARYEQLNAKLGNNSETFPICASDYSPALESVFDRVVTQLKRSYNISSHLKTKDTFLLYVNVYYNDGGLKKLEEKDYTFTNDVLSIRDHVDLTKAKEIEIYLATP